MNHRALVFTGAALTCLAVTVHALLIPDLVSRHTRGYVAALLGALVATICAIVDEHYVAALCAILITPALRVATPAVMAAKTKQDPLVAITTPCVVTDAGICFALSLFVSTPLLAATARTTPKALRVLGAAAHVITAGLIAATIALSAVLFHNSVALDSLVSQVEGAGVQSAVVHCTVAAQDSLHRLTFSILVAAGVPILIFFGLMGFTCPSTANAYHKVMTLFAIVWLGITVWNDWEAFNQRCTLPSCALSHCSLCTTAQLLRVAITVIFLPVLFASLAGDLASNEESEEDVETHTWCEVMSGAR